MRKLQIGICTVLLFTAMLYGAEGQSPEATEKTAKTESLPKPLYCAALLHTVLHSGGTTRTVSADFNRLLRDHLGKERISMENADAIDRAMEQHSRTQGKMEPSAYAELGKMLHSNYLIVPNIRDFDVKNVVVQLAPGGGAMLRRIGFFSGSLNILRAADGKQVHAIPFAEKIDFSTLPEETKEWNILRFYDYLLKVSSEKLARQTGIWLRAAEK